MNRSRACNGHPYPLPDPGAGCKWTIIFILHIKDFPCVRTVHSIVLGLNKVLRPNQSSLIRNDANSINNFRTLQTSELRHTNVNNGISARSRQCTLNGNKLSHLPLGCKQVNNFIKQLIVSKERKEKNKLWKV